MRKLNTITPAADPAGAERSPPACRHWLAPVGLLAAPLLAALMQRHVSDPNLLEPIRPLVLRHSRRQQNGLLVLTPDSVTFHQCSLELPRIMTAKFITPK
ncbi:MAG TPA: hypothetical protein VL985_13850 [Stellaceae bacterium]|nr:hypothetical protein [Stellaceae bacterium]